MGDSDLLTAEPIRPNLWNPNVAANWSLLLTPAFGAYLHAINWRALDNPERVKANIMWVWVTLVFLAINLGTIFLPESKYVDRIMQLAGLGILLGWYFTQARSQVRYIKKAFGNSYVKKRWGLPLLMGVAAIGAYCVVIAAVLCAVELFQNNLETIHTVVPEAELGKKLTVGNGELYFVPPVTEQQAQRLGQYLVDAGFLDEEPAGVQIRKEGKYYQFRMVAKKGIELDSVFITGLKELCKELSENVFKGNPVEIHICDDYFETVRVVVPL